MPPTYDIQRVEVRNHPFAVGHMTLTCPCGWSISCSRLDAPSRRAAHAAVCATCQVDDADAAAVLALQTALGDSTGFARTVLRALRSQGYDITSLPKETP